MSDEPDRQFVDTNVLVYAHDQSAGAKHEQAKRLLATLWQSDLFLGRDDLAECPSTELPYRLVRRPE